VVFVPGDPDTQTVSHFFPKVCAALQRNCGIETEARYQLSLKALLRL